jgi:hypothetical protein
MVEMPSRSVSRFNSQLWEIYMRRPQPNAWPAIWTTPAGREIGGFMKHELVPSQSITYLGEPFTTNRWGIRDQEYPATAPPGTRRIALVGSSIEMGWGVGDDQVFETIAERLLNEDRAARGGTAVEIMNFSVAAYKLPQHLLYVERALEARPHVLMFATHDVDAHMAVNHLVEQHEKGVALPHPVLRDFAERYFPDGCGPTMDLQTCMFTNTEDNHFVIDLHPDYPQVSFASPCSGHGFKFASVIGEVLADLATERETGHDISRFGITRLLHT